MTNPNGMPQDAHISVPKRPFLRRLRSVALWWGIPMACLGLIGVPRRLWGYALILIIPATFIGVMVGALILHLVAAHRHNAQDGSS